VLPFLDNPATFYEPGGQLKPEYAAYVDRLRDLRGEIHALAVEGGKLGKSLPH
jgi:hypothetical protein